jgi:phosphonopyruvate decarboxylase
VGAARQRGFTFWTGVPDTYLKPFINHVIGDATVRYVGAANEGQAIATAAGAQLAGVRSVVMLQNSGLGNAVNPLTSLAHTHRIPMLLIVTHRGQPDGEPDEPQHELMGQATLPLLDLLGVPHEPFPGTDEDFGACLDRATAWMDTRGLPYCLVMRRDAVAPVETPPARLATNAHPQTVAGAEPMSRRRDVLAALQSALTDRDVLLATTGYTGRELYAIGDRPNQLALVGAMGCASSVGLGLALTRPEVRVIVADGDGAVLMHMGALATIGHERPSNLVHVLLDNGMHESTGGQAIAAACGYTRAVSIADPAELAEFIGSATTGLTFVRVPIQPGATSPLPRPSISPPDATERMRAFVRAANG